MTGADRQNADQLMSWLWPRTIIFGVLLSITFLALPQIDIWIASQLKADDGFLLSGTWAAYAQKKVIRWLTIICALAVIIGTVIVHLPNRQHVFGMSKTDWRFLFSSLALGPGILVNTVLKEFWGRARPQYIQELGGEAEFTPPYVITNQCESNCSFVSGDSAIAFWIMAIAFVLPTKWQRPALLAGFLFGLLISFFRMGQGKHFTSDTLLAFVFVTLVSAACWRLTRPKLR
ncbi:MAG: phosphatase PAP2 family protein [Alphaproteobacteria bacterium]